MERINPTTHLDRLRHDLHRIERDMEGINPKVSTYQSLAYKANELRRMISAIERNRALAIGL